MPIALHISFVEYILSLLLVTNCCMTGVLDGLAMIICPLLSVI